MPIRFDEGPVPTGSDFQTPTEIITVTTMLELAPAFARLEAAQRAGYWLAGYASYELGYLLEPRLYPRLPTHRRLPLLQFGSMPRRSERPLWGCIRLVRHHCAALPRFGIRLTMRSHTS